MNGILNNKNNTSRKISACIIFILLQCMFLISCKKENPIKADCIPIPPYQHIGTGYNYILDSTYYSRPNFNPNNPNEIIFVKEKGLNNKLIKYNILTKEKQILYEGTIIFQPKWGKNDWILLNLPDANIWRIKSNGDSLTRITSRGGYYQPEWNIDCNNLVFYETNLPFNYFISDTYGNILDSFPNNLPAIMKWHNDSLIYYQYIFNLYCLNIQTKTNTTLYTYTDEDPEDNGIVLTNDNRLLFCKKNGINSYALNSNTVSLIKATCNSRIYLFPTYSSLIDKIIWQRLDYTLIDNENVFVKSRLYIMNSDGSNENEILID